MFRLYSLGERRWEACIYCCKHRVRPVLCGAPPNGPQRDAFHSNVHQPIQFLPRRPCILQVAALRAPDGVMISLMEAGSRGEE